MTACIIDGKAVAAGIRKDLAKKTTACSHTPVLAVVLVGENEASRIYVRNKKKAAAEVGIRCEVFEFSGSIGENALLSSIQDLSDDPHVDGIIVRLPVPPQINPQKGLCHINPGKDVDGFCPYNVGLLAEREESAVVAATPKGILKLLESTGESLEGKHVVIIGRSNIVGRPTALLLLNHDCTVTVTHSKTVNLSDTVRQADIVVAACGCPKIVKKDWIKPGAIIIDVGINRLEDGSLCGDVDFEEVKETASYITPVPGGVGPMTVAMLLENTLEAAQRHACCHDENCHCGRCGGN